MTTPANSMDNSRYLEDRVRDLEEKVELLLLTKGSISPIGIPVPIRSLALQIQMSVAAHYRLSVAELTNSKRHKLLVQPRHLAMFLMRECAAMSLNEIGEMFNKDHGTAMHGISRVRDRMACEQPFKEMVNIWLKHFAKKFSIQ